MSKFLHFPARFELKALSDEGSFEGYASVFDVVDRGGDIVVNGAFADTLANHAAKRTKPKMLWQHRHDEIPGVWTEMREDAKGLYVKGKLLMDTMRGRECHVLLKNGALDGLSIGYSASDIDYDKPRNARLLKAVDLWEISLVTFAMNTDAMVTGVKTYTPTELAGLSEGIKQITRLFKSGV